MNYMAIHILNNLVLIVFWGSLLALIYVYYGYSAIVHVLAAIKTDTCHPAVVGVERSFAIIIAVHNEESAIESRLQNLLDLDYPPDRRQIWVACDGCTDATAVVAGQFAEQGVCVINFPQNRGKAAVHNDVVVLVQADILLFTDAETIFAPDFLRVLDRYFADSRNGCGSGDLTLQPQSGIGEAEFRYWEYEKSIRYDEYRLGVLPFASGACLAIRRELYRPIPLYSAEDNYLCYTVPADGYRVFYAKEACCQDWSIPDSSRHYRKRYRTALKSLQGAMGCVSGLARNRCWGVLWALVSHRLFRWQSGFLLALMLLSNFLLLDWGGSLYHVTFIVQLLGYLAAICGWWLDGRRHVNSLTKPFIFAYSFVLANIAFCHAVLHSLAGKRLYQYRPARQNEIS